MRSKLLVTGVAALFVLSACGGADPEVEELKGFFTGSEPSTADAATLDRLNTVFARQAVRGGAYAAESAGGIEGERWSPVLQRRDAVVAASVEPWLTGGVIDGAGRFAPGADEAGTDEELLRTLPEEQQRVGDVAARLARLSKALQVLAGKRPAVRWTPGAEAGIELDATMDNALVNPRVLDLLRPQTALVQLDVPAAAQFRAAEQRIAASDDGVRARPLPAPEARFHDDGGGSSSGGSSGRCECSTCCTGSTVLDLSAAPLYGLAAVPSLLAFAIARRRRQR